MSLGAAQHQPVSARRRNLQILHAPEDVHSTYLANHSTPAGVSASSDFSKNFSCRVEASMILDDTPDPTLGLRGLAERLRGYSSIKFHLAKPRTDRNFLKVGKRMLASHKISPGNAWTKTNFLMCLAIYVIARDIE